MRATFAPPISPAQQPVSCLHKTATAGRLPPVTGDPRYPSAGVGRVYARPGPSNFPYENCMSRVETCRCSARVILFVRHRFQPYVVPYFLLIQRMSINTQPAKDAPCSVFRRTLLLAA